MSASESTESMTERDVKDCQLVTAFLIVLSDNASSDVTQARAQRARSAGFKHIGPASGVEMYSAHAGSLECRGAMRDVTLVLGDDEEWAAHAGDGSMGNAAVASWNRATGIVRIVSSIVGLPPVFIYQNGAVTAFASELRLFREIGGLTLTLDPEAAADVVRVGYPLWHRTMSREVRLMPGGHALEVRTGGAIAMHRSWEPPRRPQGLTAQDVLEAQASAFRDAMKRLRLQETVLSLTGGLDTRAIYAMLGTLGVRLPATTISGGLGTSLDARMARDLSRKAGMSHTVVSLGSDFFRQLPELAVEASRLSGGISSIDQAHEVYYYRSMAGTGTRRLSGYLGNQVGRRGVEGVSMRNADSSILGQAAPMQESAGHWLSESGSEELPFFMRLLQHEVPFSSVGNQTVGQSFMIQQSPYATRTLIDTASWSSVHEQATNFAPREARFRDLRHRFLGEPAEQSFQRKVISECGGFAARYPINWGWRAAGGVSPKGLAMGMLAFMDAAAGRLGFVQPVLRLAGARGLHEIRPVTQWLDTHLRTFINDTLRSSAVAHSQILDSGRLVRILDQHFSGAERQPGTVLAAVDLALAEQSLTRG
jgi:asparagine synthase (glutamine-hydrolysing)